MMKKKKSSLYYRYLKENQEKPDEDIFFIIGERLFGRFVINGTTL